MQSVLFLAALALGAAAQDLTINTPTTGGVAGAAECQPLLLQWSGGTPPYIISVDTVPAGASHVAEFDNQSGTQVTWPALNASQNTQLLLTIKDNTGLTKTSAAFPVTAGSGDGCLTSGSGGGSSPSNSGSAGSAPPATSGSAGSAPPATSGPAGGSNPSNSATTPAGSNTAKSGSSPSSSASGAGSSTTPGAAMGLKAPAGVVPAFAAVALAGLVALLA